MRLVGTETYGAVLCDTRMPQMSGLAFARYVRAQRPELPILLMTGEPQLESALEAIEVGILEYLSKPIKPARIRSAVVSAIKATRDDNALSARRKTWWPASRRAFSAPVR